jgi:double zinc ribbon protein
MDALDRTFKHLLQTIQARYPAYLVQPFEVSELYQNILPYRHHRRELGLETNQDYELVLLQLLSGARDYLVVNDEMRERLARELASPNPDPGAFREFSTAQIALSPAAVRRFQSGAVSDAEVALAGAGSIANSDANPRPSSRVSAAATTTAARSSSTAATAPSLAAQPAPRRPSAAPAPAVSAAIATPRATTAAAPPVARPTQTMVPLAGEPCRYCNGALPTGRRITFCPHCGQNLTVVNCLACGTELELGWKFCTTCGRPVTAT